MTNAQAPRRANVQPVANQLVTSLADEAEAGRCVGRAADDRSNPPPRQ